MTPTEYLPLGLSPETALSLGLGAAAFATVFLLGRAFMPHDPMGARIKAHAKRRAQLHQQLIATPRRGRQAHVGLLRSLVDRLKLTQGEESRSSADKLAQAGLRSRDALVVFLSLRLILPLVIAAAAWLLIETMSPAMTLTYKLFATVIGAVLGAYGPSLVLGNMVKRRQKSIQKALPDALDLLVICAEAGLSLDGALTRVAARSPRRRPSSPTSLASPRSNWASCRTAPRLCATCRNASTWPRSAASSTRWRRPRNTGPRSRRRCASSPPSSATPA